ncbi:MAG: DUF2178 domain-containing protein [Actinomycetota bacterium]|nr:DUF2178 domain-containing protein [Actinomycetota bacterium]MDQ2956615.1 DUF2178 domain-containing protein [Actinomycetota bacterium]
MSRNAAKNRLRVPAACLVFGLVYLGIGLGRGDLALGFGGLAIMVGYGTALLLFGRRSEPIGLLGGEVTDERRAAIQLRASATTGQILVLVLVAGLLWSLATGSSYAGVFCGLCAVGGAVFIGSTAWFAHRG